MKRNKGSIGRGLNVEITYRVRWSKKRYSNSRRRQRSRPVERKGDDGVHSMFKTEG